MTSRVATTPAGWYIACRSSDLRQRPVRIVLSGRPFALFRTARGEIGAVEDRCLHRGAPLSKGRVCQERLTCPYHGWEYSTDGRVGRIPANPACALADPKFSLPALRTKERQGFVWVAIGNPGTGPVEFAHLGEPGWTSFVMRTRFRGTVETCLENFLDCPHATFVHKHWFRAPTNRPVRAVVQTLSDGAQAEYFDEPRKQSLVWWLLAPVNGSMRHVDRFIAPNTSRVDYQFPKGLHYVITSSCCPVHDTETLVHTVISFRFRWLGPLVRLFFEPLSRWIIRQDQRMIEAQQFNLVDTPSRPFVSTEVDLLGRHISAWRSALLTGAPPPPAEERHVTLHL